MVHKWRWWRFRALGYRYERRRTTNDRLPVLPESKQCQEKRNHKRSPQQNQKQKQTETEQDTMHLRLDAPAEAANGDQKDDGHGRSDGRHSEDHIGDFTIVPI